jgi:hypothetical protein
MNQVQPVRTVPQHIFVANFLYFSVSVARFSSAVPRLPGSRLTRASTSTRCAPFHSCETAAPADYSPCPFFSSLPRGINSFRARTHILFPQPPSNAQQFASSINQFSFDWLHQCRGSGKPDLYEMFNKISFNRPDQSFSSRIF